MKNRACPICASKDSEIIKKIDMNLPKDYHLPDNYNVVICKKCGMSYADTKATMEDYEWYYSNCNFYGDDCKDDNSTRYEMVEGFLEEYCQKDDIMLDIGAGNGRFEMALKKNGYEYITGVDPSNESVERLRKAGIRSYMGNIYSFQKGWRGKKYNCIFLFEVAEHLLKPDKGIENVVGLLEGNGVCIVSVPNYSKIGIETKHSIPNYFNLEHINYFSEVSLSNLMGRFGLLMVAQKMCGEDLIQCYRKVNIPIEIKKDVITKRAICDYFSSQERREDKISNVIRELKERQVEVVIWGTGSYVMSLVATTDLLQCNIKGFVDNNRIKQGRTMYGYMVYKPEFLIDKNYIVIICSMLNSKDILVQLKDMDIKNDFIVL